MNLGVLISGRGSNLSAVLEKESSGELPTRTKVVFSNVPSAPGLEHARRRGIPAIARSHTEFASRAAFDEAMVAELRAHGAEWILLAGFMRIVSKTLLEAFPDRVINIHPSLLPSFPGLHAQRQALDYGVRQTGCTVHLVDEGTDTGPILAQAALPVLTDDTEESLSARLLDVEHTLLVATLARIATARFALETSKGRRRVLWNA